MSSQDLEAFAISRVKSIEKSEHFDKNNALE